MTSIISSRAAATAALYLCLTTAGAGVPFGGARKQPALDGDIDRQRLLAAARAGGDYLVRMQKPDGSFHYFYNAAEDRDVSQTYNIVRHAGTAISLFDLYSETRDIRYLESARLAVKFLETRFKRVPHKRALYVLDFDRKAKLGASGLALLALSKLIDADPKSPALATAPRLAELILMLQRADGSFKSRYRIRKTEPPALDSLYYPGEAMLGLIRLFKLTGSDKLLDSARRGADYLVKTQREMDLLPPDAWLMQALEALYEIGREPRYASHLLALADAMIAVQYTEVDKPEFAGGFGPGPARSTPAASRAEGLLAAYRIARVTGDPRAAKIKASLQASAKFQLGSQVTTENSGTLPNPSRASGGFYAGPDDPRIRIDFVQHNISSLLGIAGTLY